MALGPAGQLVGPGGCGQDAGPCRPGERDTGPRRHSSPRRKRPESKSSLKGSNGTWFPETRLHRRQPVWHVSQGQVGQNGGIREASGGICQPCQASWGSCWPSLCALGLWVGVGHHGCWTPNASTGLPQVPVGSPLLLLPVKTAQGGGASAAPGRTSRCLPGKQVMGQEGARVPFGIGEVCRFKGELGGAGGSLEAGPTREEQVGVGEG